MVQSSQGSFRCVLLDPKQQLLSQQTEPLIRQMSSRNITPSPYRKPPTNIDQNRYQPRSRRPSQDSKVCRTEQQPYQHTFAEYFKQNCQASKISTRSSTENSNPVTRRSTLSVARSLGRAEKYSEGGEISAYGGQKEERIFAELSNLLKNEEVLVNRYREKLETSKNKVTTIFLHLKQDLKIILEKQQFIICEQLNSRFKSFINLFSNTKLQIHQLYYEKIRLFSTHETYMNGVNQHLNDVLRMNSNYGLLSEMKAQNSQAMFARKYEAFFQNKRKDFERLVAMKNEIDGELEEDIFDYSGNMVKLKQLKETFQSAAESMFINNPQIQKQSHGQ